MKRTVMGILAHVDAGKTTLSEAMLYAAGNIRKFGRVDHGDSFLDTDVQERERGITIYAKQAMLTAGETEITLLDTPGHVDFSAETERTLQVLDYAILVISGTDGVQGHTRTLWNLLARYHVPTFLFINKMDLAGTDRLAVLSDLQRKLSSGCIDFSKEQDPALRNEAAAMTDEAALETYLETGALDDDTLRDLIARRAVFPCLFGAALRQEGVDEFLQLLDTYTVKKTYPAAFGARVFKISRDGKGQRLTHIKMTGGTLRAKALLSGGEGDSHWEEKANELRLYSGTKHQSLEEAEAGMVIAVTGLTKTYPGQGLGQEVDAPEARLEPVLNYRLLLPEGTDAHTVLPKLKQLEEEDPMLRILWNERLREIHIRLMGQVQLEVLERQLLDRFSLAASFGTGSIVYKETIEDTVLGVGHFEPLRHYAEAQLLLEPLPRGSGLVFKSTCPLSVLDTNWQRLILTHLAERTHVGVLTGSAITDMQITLVAGRAHLKHTEGGDFRQATYRAIRQGLMQAKSLLLEPHYDFRMELPMSAVGRALTDLETMGAVTDAPETEGEFSVLTGHAPVAALTNYGQELAAYTHGQGQLSCTLRGYEPCKNAEEVIASIGYDAERDIDNPADSVFCAHGAGYTVKWQDVHANKHVDAGIRLGKADIPETSTRPAAPRTKTADADALDAELAAIFERTYGKTDRGAFRPTKQAEKSTKPIIPDADLGPEYLLVDGYNILFAWEDLKEIAKTDMAAARGMLEEILINYRAYRGTEVILVFDAYKVKGNPGSVEQREGIYIVYTKEAETADVYIERTTAELSPKYRVRVATSDGLEQVIILGHGAFRLSAQMFRKEVEQTQLQIAGLIAAYNQKNALHRVKIADAITVEVPQEGEA